MWYELRVGTCLAVYVSGRVAMAFAPVLNSYCIMLGCSNKLIAERCGISMSALSRYRSGKRTPRVDSDAINRLARGISQLARERRVSAASSEKDVKKALNESLVRSKPLGPSFSIRVDSLMKLLGVKNADVAVPMHLDPSYISRIRRGERSPNDKKHFAEVVAQVSALSCMEQGMLKELLILIGAENELAGFGELNVDSALGLAATIDRWLLGNQVVESDIVAVDELFSMLDQGRYNDIINMPRKTSPIVACPVQSGPTSRFYRGEDYIWRAEIDFLESASACGAKRLYLSSDMPAFETTLAPDKVTLYQQSILELIDSECEITVIQDPDRPLRQALAFLQMWIPLYMTGHVKPLYLEGGTSRVFCHVNNVCECCALASEAIRGHEESGRYYITSMPDDLDYYQSKMNVLLEKTHVLLEIYRNDDLEGMSQFRREEAIRQASGRGIEVKAGAYEHLRIMSYQGDCIVVYLDDPLEFRFVIRHPKLRYVISHMR